MTAMNPSTIPRPGLKKLLTLIIQLNSGEANTWKTAPGIASAYPNRNFF